MTAPATFTTPMVMTVLDGNRKRSTARVDWCWTAEAHPEVQLVIRAHTREIVWVFARDLLAVGLHTATGDGDVRIDPDPAGGVVSICLRTDETAAVLSAHADDLAAFLAATVEHTPLDAPIEVPDSDWSGWCALGGGGS